MAVDIRRMGKDELDELNRLGREYREGKKPSQSVAEPAQELSETPEPLLKSAVEQLDLF